MREHWRANSLMTRTGLRQLLASRASFTRALSAYVGQPVAVTVLGQGWCRHPELGRVFRREVVLHSGARRWVYAQTLMRPTGLSGANRELRHLQNRPLGELLFAGKSRRLDLRMTRLSPHCGLRRRAQAHQLAVPVGSHARCSWFDYHGSALLVHECLLPELLGHDSAQ